MSEDYTSDYKFQERMLQKQQDADPNAIYADSMREEKIKNIIAQLNPEALLTDIEHRIRGQRKNSFTGEWENIGNNKEDIIDEKLIQNYVSFLNVYLTQNNSLSNYSIQEINNIMKIVIEYIRDDLCDNSINYGLTKQKTIKKVVPKYKLVLSIDKTGATNYQYEKFEEEIEMPIGEEITDYNEFNRIGHIVCQSTFSVLKQAQGGMLANRIFKALRVTEDISSGGKGVANALKFW